MKFKSTLNMLYNEDTVGQMKMPWTSLQQVIPLTMLTLTCETCTWVFSFRSFFCWKYDLFPLLPVINTCKSYSVNTCLQRWLISWWYTKYKWSPADKRDICRLCTIPCLWKMSLSKKLRKFTKCCSDQPPCACGHRHRVQEWWLQTRGD